MLKFLDVLTDISFAEAREVRLRLNDRTVEISLTDAEFNKFQAEVPSDGLALDLSDISFDPKDLRIEQLDHENWTLKQEKKQLEDLAEESQKINFGLLKLLKQAKAKNVQLSLEVESWVEQVKRERGIE